MARTKQTTPTRRRPIKSIKAPRAVRAPPGKYQQSTRTHGRRPIKSVKAPRAVRAPPGKQQPTTRTHVRRSKVHHYDIPRAAFKRVVDDVLIHYNEMQYMPRFKPAAVDALQAAAEDFIEDLFRSAKLCAKQAKRKTVTPEDIHLVMRLRGEKW